MSGYCSSDSNLLKKIKGGYMSYVPRVNKWKNEIKEP